MPREEDDEDYDDRPRKKKKSRGGSGVPCPECGSRSQRMGPWPWYLGTLGAMLCRAVICNDCDHHFDAKKPSADLATRKRNLAIVINGIGAVGIILVLGCLGALIVQTMGPRG